MSIKYFTLPLLLLLLLCTSCATSIKTTRYDFQSQDVPAAFDSCRIAFISDLHYKSLFNEKRLNKLVRKLQKLHPDVLLMGGDYQEGCQYVAPLFDALGEVKPPLGTYGVLGNNDYERCYEDIVQSMKRNGMHLLEHKTDTIWLDDEYILVAGVRNPFDLKENGTSPTTRLSEDDFVLLLVHTPDYAQRVEVPNTDLVLAGHTHGGQVCILGYAPMIPSIYGKRFRYGKVETDERVPMIVTSGLGTSQRKVRIGIRPEVVVVTLISLPSLPE